MATLPEDDIRAGLAELDGWEREGDAIVKEFRLADFRAAMAFVLRLSYEAEAANHHPDIDIRYGRVRLSLSTHGEGGLTGKDLSLARAIEDQVVGEAGSR